MCLSPLIFQETALKVLEAIIEVLQLENKALKLCDLEKNLHLKKDLMFSFQT